MVGTLKFLRVLISFLTIFLMIIICAFYFIPDSGPCVTDKDCEQEIGYIVKCDTNTGFCVKILQRS
ncbi:putative Late nodulin [Medicago truncatula]|uniref:Putative Late nodulin n=1 Tax=Medicago truncatula TaxID=3880 RepID=A0A396GUR9_MEDTR|nr:putative Late nodulin [Medicago truncatula]